MRTKSIDCLLVFFLCTTALSLHLKQEIPNSLISLGDTQAFLNDSHNYFVTKQGNVVWAGALSLAWHQLSDNIIKEDIKLNSPDKIVQKITNNFNSQSFKKNDLSQSDYYIKSGYGQKTVTQINTQVKKKFPNKTFSDIDQQLQDRDIISYAYLSKSFQYPVQFKADKSYKFKNKTVDGFSATTDQHRRQVGYFYYENNNEFMVKLKTKKQNEGVYLLRTNHKSAKVQDIINQVVKWQKQSQSQISEDDYFSMPVIDLDYFREVGQIEHLRLLNKNFTDYELAKVYQALKLKVDETGVKVQNQGVIIAKLTATMFQPPVQHKYFILNDTFWIVLKQVGKYPYLCIKINQPKEKI